MSDHHLDPLIFFIASSTSHIFLKLDSMGVPQIKTATPASRTRKVIHKTTVTVKIGPYVGKQKNEGSPSDLWSWRKYGQKPIKGSPYPRGYYKCSTSKGCSAKKQVERCRTDDSVLIITYTSSHNHPTPVDHHTTSPEQEPLIQDNPTTSLETRTQEPEENQTLVPTITSEESEDLFHYFQYPICCSQDININPLMGRLLDEEPLSYSQLLTFSTPTSEENDFFDDLEELPTASAFTNFMKNMVDERMRILPS